MTLEEAKDEMLKFVKLKTTMMPVFATVIMEQAEPVIRCKDCKCMKMIVKNSLGYKLGIYDGECGVHCLYVKDNDFCRWGERRDNE